MKKRTKNILLVITLFILAFSGLYFAVLQTYFTGNDLIYSKNITFVGYSAIINSNFNFIPVSQSWTNPNAKACWSTLNSDLSTTSNTILISSSASYGGPCAGGYFTSDFIKAFVLFNNITFTKENFESLKITYANPNVPSGCQGLSGNRVIKFIAYDKANDNEIIIDTINPPDTGNIKTYNTAMFNLDNNKTYNLAIYLQNADCRDLTTGATEQQSLTISEILLTKKPCVESWSCNNWTNCNNSIQSRSCADANNCGAINNKPAETQNCVMPITAECNTARDCVPVAGCHPNSCILSSQFIPIDNSKGEIICSQSCSGPLDCGAGSCGCLNSRCAVIATPIVNPIINNTIINNTIENKSCVVIPTQPCDGASWSDYPACSWDTQYCKIPNNTNLYIGIGIGATLLILIVLYYKIRKNSGRRKY